MTSTALIDSWASYGPRPDKDPEERFTLQHLLEDMEWAGISAALVRHTQMAQYDVMHVNLRLIQEIAPHRNKLFPCWTVLPHHFGDFPAPKELISQMKRNDVRAVYFQPAANAYPVVKELLSPLARVLNPGRTLILTTFEQLGSNYNSIISFCKIFHKCPILIGQVSWGEQRLVTAVMNSCPNVHIEFHLLQANRAVEHFAEKFGINRLLFGTGLMHHSPGAARGFIDWTLLNEKETAQFSGGNIMRLLQSPHTIPAQSPSTPDSYISAASMQKPLSGLILDAHCHVLDDGLNCGGKGYVMIRGDIENMITLNKRMGITAAAMMSWSGTVCMDVSAGNALIENITDRFPGQVIGLSSCDPTHQSAEEINEVCMHLHKKKLFCGLKPYYTNNLSYAHPLYEPYFKFADTENLYGLFHVAPASGGMDAIHTLAQKYPGMTIIIAHSGGRWAFARQVAHAVNTYPNVMAELTLTPVPNGIIEWLCAQTGSDRILFGTDAPMRDPRPQLGWCVYTRLSQTDKEKILGLNFKTVLQRSAQGRALRL